MSDDVGLKSGSILGEEAKPPFVVLPDPAAVFARRAKRFVGLAPQSDLAPYLSFLGTLAQAQHDIQSDLPPVQLPLPEQMAQAIAHGMPAAPRMSAQPDDAMQRTVVALLQRLTHADIPPESAAVVHGLLGASTEELVGLIAAALSDANPGETVAARVLVIAGLQVHFARVASRLPAAELKPVADAACPVCGSGPVASAIVGWPKAFNTRFCTCSLCSTMWNVVRVKCLVCGSMDGISFRAVDGQPDTVKAETCEKCRTYVKVVYQVKDPSLEPFADDVGTLGLDMLLAQDGWKRGGQNPFLLGY